MQTWFDYLKAGLSRTVPKDKLASEEKSGDTRSRLRSLQPYLARHWRKWVVGAVLILFVTLLAFPHARGEERMRVDLAETAPGHYTTRAGMVRTGIWELRLVAQRGDDSFTTTLLHSVGAVP